MSPSTATPEQRHTAAAARPPAADDAWMGMALAAAAGRQRACSPRPAVGAVVVAPDGSAWTGTTDGRTGAHAEVVALTAAGPEVSRGATAYTTLEPCSHHGRTPPCADALVEAGVARVVIALADPDPLVAGQGIARLEAAGIAVSVGVRADDAEAQLAAYLHHRRTGRPLVVLKLASTLDGRTAAPDGSSRWITGDAARLDAHRLRAECDGILVGAGTVRSDDPALTVRLPADEPGGPFEDPQRFVLGTAPARAAIRPCTELHGALPDVLDDLGGRGIVQLLVEGGAGVAHDLHAAGLVDRYVLYLAPALLGGDDAHPLFAGSGAATVADAWRGRISAVTPLGDDLRIDLVPRNPDHDLAPTLIDGES